MKEDNLNKLFRDEFTDFKMKPSNSVWVALSKKLWWVKFWTFSFTTLNVYSSAILLLFMGGSLFAIYNLSGDNQINGRLDAISKVKTETNTTINTSEALKSEKEASNKTIDTRSENNIKEDVSTIEKANTANTILPDNSDEESELVNKQIVVSEKSENIKTQQKSSFKKPALSSEENIKRVQTDKPVNEIKELLKGAKNVSKSGKIDGSLGRRTTSKQLLIEGGSNITVYDTIKIFDTIPVYDTISINKSRSIDKHKKKKRRKWFLDLYTGVNNSTLDYTSATGGDLQEATSSATAPALGFAFGARMIYRIEQFNIEAGLEYNQVNESFSFAAGNSDEIGSFYIYKPNGTISIRDTIETRFVWDDELNAYIEIPVLRDSVVQLYDSTLIKNFETEYTNKYSYLNIPLMFGYNIYENEDFTITAKAGGVVGLKLNSKGKSITIKEGDQLWMIGLDDESVPFMDVNLNWQVGFTFNYRINNKLQFILDPYYRRGTSSLYKDSYVLGSTLGLFGVNAGLRYKF